MILFYMNKNEILLIGGSIIALIGSFVFMMINNDKDDGGYEEDIDYNKNKKYIENNDIDNEIHGNQYNTELIDNDKNENYYENKYNDKKDFEDEEFYNNEIENEYIMPTIKKKRNTKNKSNRNNKSGRRNKN